MKLKFAILLTGLLMVQGAFAQIVNSVPDKVIKGIKDRVTCIAMSPKEDRVLVGFGEYAALYDLEKGKKVMTFEHDYNGNKAVYAVGFNADASMVYTIDGNGKKRFWEVKNGKIGQVNATTDFSPGHREVLAMGLNVRNDPKANYYYLQKEVELPGKKITVKSGKAGAIQFINSETSKVVQELKFEDNKDMFHYPPVYVTPNGEWLITGTDNGEVRFYSLK